MTKLLSYAAILPFYVGAVLAEPLSPQGRSDRGARESRVFKARIIPHWFQDNQRFWYRNRLPEDRSEFMLVDAEKGTRQLAFDHEKLAKALALVLGKEVDPERLPFDQIAFGTPLASIMFEVNDKTWVYDAEQDTCSEADSKLSASSNEGRPSDREGNGRSRRRRGEAVVSPDGNWSASIEDHNIILTCTEGEKRSLTNDGNAGDAYQRVQWSPDSKALVAWKVVPGERKEVHLVESSPKGAGRAVLSSRPYALPGDRFSHYHLHVFQVDEGKQHTPDVDPLELEWQRPQIHWHRDGRHFSYSQVDRGHQRFRIMCVDAYTGEAKITLDEWTDTFIWTAHTENVRVRQVNWLSKTDEIIYASERDGWRHLYLIDANEGGDWQAITSGNWVVRGVDQIDEEARQVWFHASGRHAGQDPYLIHYFRVNFDGTGLVALTKGNGTHSVQYSPDRRFLVDTFSRIDRAPVSELRRVSDGSLVCKLEEADITLLEATDWEAPEVFVSKARDGKTDIWGIICRPPDFDSNKKYPVIEQIYAGPQSSYVPKRFSERRRFSDLTDLGFIVVQVDCMGTANRSKAFHDVCWHNLKDAGFPDRILWHEAIAAKYSYYDLSRVGIYGTSAGGQNAGGAVLFHGDFYKAAVAASGCHDNRMDKASWNEQWMGYPVGKHYSESSNVDNAYRLSGKLFLIVGELDRNVPPESTMRFVDALVKADKDFDMLVVPGAGHGMGGSYGRRRMRDFFVRHLQP